MHPRAAEQVDAVDEAVEQAELVGGEAAAEALRAEAESVDSRDVKPFTGSATLVAHNVRTGLAAVMRERAWFEREPDAPKIDFARLQRCDEAARALVFVTRRAEQVVVKRPAVRAMCSRAAASRKVLLKAADALVDAGVFDADVVATIRAGRGWIDTAQDYVDLATLFRSNASRTRGKTAVKAEQIREAAELGAALLDVLKPGGARASSDKPEAQSQALLLRDRMAVVVSRRYAEVERAAGWRWGRALDEHVPAMLSRVRAAPRQKAPADGGAKPAPPT